MRWKILYISIYPTHKVSIYTASAILEFGMATHPFLCLDAASHQQESGHLTYSSYASQHGLTDTRVDEWRIFATSHFHSTTGDNKHKKGFLCGPKR